MLQQLIQIFIVSFICCIWGLPVALIAKNDAVTRINVYRSWPCFLSFLFFSGCITLSVLASWLYLFMPLRFGYLIILSAIAILLLSLFCKKKISLLFQISFRNRPGLNAVRLLFVFLCLVLFWIMSCLPTSNGDTQIYHLGIIRWTNEYPVVPGMANLFPRLGLGSNWFGLISFLQTPLFTTPNFYYLNAALSIWFFIWLFANWSYHWNRLTQNAAHRILCSLYFLILAYALLDWELFRDCANSTNYDLIVTASLIICFCSIAEGILETQPEFGFSPVLVIFLISSIGFKFSGIFSFALVLFHLKNNRSLKNLAMVILATGFVLCPVLIRNYIVSGYPLYPLPVSIGTPDWQLPRQMTSLLYNYITLSNRFYNRDFVNSFAFKEQNAHWVVDWFWNILWQHRIVLSLCLASTTLFFIKIRALKNGKELKQLLFILLLMLAGWFASAPNPRFGFGVILFTAFLPLSLFLGPKIKPWMYELLLLISCFSVCAYLGLKTSSLSKQPSFWLEPAAIKTPGSSLVIINGNYYHLPQKLVTDSVPRCYHTELPCICQENRYLHWRGNTPAKGFSMQPLPDTAFVQHYNY